MKSIRRIRRLRSLKRDLYALYLAMRDPRVSRLPKLIVGVVVAYALSPIDLVPDFIPVLGWLDDLVILPAGIWLAIRLLPRNVWVECRARASRVLPRLRRSVAAAVVVVLIWLVLLVVIAASLMES